MAFSSSADESRLPVPLAGGWPARLGPPPASCERIMVDTATFGDTFQLLAIQNGMIVYEDFGPGEAFRICPHCFDPR